MTIWLSRFTWRSVWPECARCHAALEVGAVPSCDAAPSSWSRVHNRLRCTINPCSSPVTSIGCWSI
jgi:hypothetical protein